MQSIIGSTATPFECSSVDLKLNLFPRIMCLERSCICKPGHMCMTGANPEQRGDGGLRL